jgi:uncharacterized protein YcfJ
MKAYQYLTAISLTMVSFGSSAQSSDWYVNSQPVQEYGRVVSSTPIVNQVSEPSQSCTVVNETIQQPNAGGALAGAIIGGAIGNSIGGHHRTGSTIVGAILGSAIGGNVEPTYSTASRQVCTVVNNYRNVIVGYSVVYNFRGQRFETQMSSPVQVGDAILVSSQQQIYVQPTPVYVPPPVFIYDGGERYKHRHHRHH